MDRIICAEYMQQEKEFVVSHMGVQLKKDDYGENEMNLTSWVLA